MANNSVCTFVKHLSKMYAPSFPSTKIPGSVEGAASFIPLCWIEIQIKYNHHRMILQYEK